MPKRNGTPAERAARDRVKQRYNAQLSAINDFFAREGRIEALRSDVATLEAEQGRAAVRLVEATSVAQAAEILGWTQARLREAVASNRQESSRVQAGDQDVPSEVRC